MRNFNQPRFGHQSGAVLIVAMIILVILTLLGVTAMNTTSLQERIAANSQEQLHAFQAAETGLNRAFANNAAFDITALAYDTTTGYTGGDAVFMIPGAADAVVYRPMFMGFATPPPGSGSDINSASSTQAAHFNFRAVGTSETGRTKSLNQGAYILAPSGG